MKLDFDSSDMPVKAVLPQLGAAVAACGTAVLTASPGAGKTTLAPPFLLEGCRGRIVLLEPRRVAARLAAARIAELYGGEPGGIAGYAVRGESRVSAATRLIAMTPGVLLRRLQRDPALDGVDMVIFDEFHERSLESDLDLSLLLEVRRNLREELKIVVMSATIDAGAVSRFLGGTSAGAPVIDAPGRNFPVELLYGADGFERSRPGAAAARGVCRLLSSGGGSSGSVLVFLPGVREIDECFAALSARSEELGFELLRLHGRLPLAEQSRVLKGGGGRRRVILATNLAESSVTVPDVTAVVDCGLEKRLIYDPAEGFSRLRTVRISAESAGQRAGRAGRTAPGTALRLWSEHDQRALLPARTPEIAEADLAPLAMELAAWGSDELSWLTPPPPARLAAARESLVELGALDAGFHLTGTGRKIIEFPLHPMTAALLLYADRRGLAPLGCEIAAVLEERDEGGAATADLREMIGELRRRPEKYPARQAAVRRLLELCRTGYRRCETAYCGELLAAAFPGRIAMARGRYSCEFLLADGFAARLADGDDLCQYQFLVAAGCEGGAGGDPFIRVAAPLDKTEFEAATANRVEESVEVVFDPDSQRSSARKRLKFGALTLADTPCALPDPAAVGAAVLAEAQKRGIALPPEGHKAAFALFKRLDFARRCGEDIAELDCAGLAACARPFLAGVRSFADLEKIDWCAVLNSALDPAARRMLDCDYPEDFTTPAGARHRIDYGGAKPVLAVKVQELYGVRSHPVIGRKKLKLQLHLLNPAGRPVQITEDLPGFWQGSWKLAQKDLKMRYPKHFWPDDPAGASPGLRSVKPRR